MTTKTKTRTLTLENEDQVLLYRQELTGQFSDGHWENNHGKAWRTWSSHDLVVTTGKIIGHDFEPEVKARYQLADIDLLLTVGERMIQMVHIRRAYPQLDEITIADLAGFNCDEEAIRRSRPGIMERIKKAAPLDEIRRIAQTEDDYDGKALTKDLRAIQRAMRTRSDAKKRCKRLVQGNTFTGRDCMLDALPDSDFCKRHDR